jgi:hypothetical protein
MSLRPSLIHGAIINRSELAGLREQKSMNKKHAVGGSIHNAHQPAPALGYKHPVNPSRNLGSVHPSNSARPGYEDHKRSYRANQSKSLIRAKRKAQNLCRCGSEPVAGRKYCRRCLDRSARWNRTHRESRIREGYCAHTGVCTLRPLPNRRMCRRHLESAAAEQKRRNTRMMNAGRCVRCGKELSEGRARNCLRCQPTLDGKTRLQKRRARERKQESSRTRMIQQRIQWNARIETILHDHPNRRTAAILRMRCGINEEYDHTLKEVGEHFEISRERVRQIEHEILGASLSKARHRSFNK